MSKKRLTVLTIIITILIFLISGSLVYVNDYYHAEYDARRVIADGHEGITISKIDKGYEFAPEGAETGIIFYPGAKVECEAYAPLMCELAEEGYLCILVDMPFRFAILDVDAADGIQSKYPEIESWYLMGHSLGGAMVSSYAEKHAGFYDGVILLAAYSTDDLSLTDLKVCSIYGSEDKVLNKKKYEKNKKNLPADFEEHIIEGGCHAYFGCYGAQSGDGKPTISKGEQIAETVEIISEFIKWKNN